MASTWRKLTAGLAFLAVLSQVGVASAGKSCGSHRPSAARAFTPSMYAPATYAPETYAPETYIPETYIPQTVAPSPIVRPAAVESAAVAPLDLEFYDIRRVDDGTNEQGPLYRLMVKNLGNTDVTSGITVALLASMEKNSDDNVSVIGSLESLEAGATKSVDLRLPKGAELLTYLTVAVAPVDGTDANETDNVAIYEQAEVLAVR